MTSRIERQRIEDKAYAKGYGEALADLAAAAETDGLEGLLRWMKFNATVNNSSPENIALIQTAVEHLDFSHVRKEFNV